MFHRTVSNVPGIPLRVLWYCPHRTPQNAFCLAFDALQQTFLNVLFRECLNSATFAASFLNLPGNFDAARPFRAASGLKKNRESSFISSALA